MPTYKQIGVFIMQHRKNFLQAGAGVLVLFLVAVGWSIFWKTKVSSSIKAYGELQISTPGLLLEERIKTYEVFIDRYASTPLGHIAAFELGNMLFEKKEYEKAASLFKDVSHARQQKPLLAVAGLNMLGRCSTELQKHEEALRAYREAIHVPGNLVKLESRYQEGLALERLGKFADAKQVYQEIRVGAESMDQQVKQRSEERLLWLAARERETK